MNEKMNDIDPRMADTSAVSVYETNGVDDFPVLKAFQQYIDAEQAKARKRMLMVCGVFGFVLIIVIAVFVVLLVNAGSRNQAMNDRLLEYVMKDREHRTSAPVVVQQPQDNSALIELTKKLEEMKKSIAEKQSEKTPVPMSAVPVAVVEERKGSSAESIEIERLKVLLAAEKEKTASEREKKKELELEAYRREHYPELYGMKRQQPSRSRQSLIREEAEADREIESILDDTKAINYFDDEEDDEIDELRSRLKRNVAKRKGKSTFNKDDNNDIEDNSSEESIKPVEKESTKPETTQKEAASATAEDGFRIPVDVKKNSGLSWTIPLN